MGLFVTAFKTVSVQEGDESSATRML